VPRRIGRNQRPVGSPHRRSVHVPSISTDPMRVERPVRWQTVVAETRWRKTMLRAMTNPNYRPLSVSTLVPSDAASIAVSHRHRRAKTDQIDGETLIRNFLAYTQGEPAFVQWSGRLPRGGGPPSDRPQALVAERTLHISRLKGLALLPRCSELQACSSGPPQRSGGTTNWRRSRAFRPPEGPNQS
jgi:hypothetical protein